jgi:type VI secretion system protein ImpC
MEEERQGQNLAEDKTVGTESVLDQLLSKVDLAVPAKASSLEAAYRGDEASAKLAHAVSYLVGAVTAGQAKLDKLDKNFLDSVISEIDKKLTAQVNEIMHHPDFQKLESAWRGLRFAVDRTDFRANIKIELLNCPKSKLLEDFSEAPETVQSGLYRQLYTQEYDQAGAAPFTCIVGNYEFDASPQDMSLLENVTKVAAATHCPFISSVGHRFFGQKSMEALAAVPDLSGIFKQAEYIKWNSFRDSEDSRYVGLAVTKFLLRHPYGEGNPVKTFHFEEDVIGKAENYLWGNPAFAFLANVNRSFAKNGWAVNIRGPQAGGKVEDLPVHVYEAAGGTQLRIPTEIMIDDTRELELAENGFMPLTVYKNHDFAAFFSAQSAQRPKKYSTSDATANAKLSARLPYLFLVSRLAHYLKVMQREVIGSSKEREDVEKDLNNWINGLVTKDPSPTEEQKAKWPLRAAQVEVAENPDNPGYYQVSMRVRPHFQVEGVNVDLSLVSRMSKKK